MSSSSSSESVSQGLAFFAGARFLAGDGEGDTGSAFFAGDFALGLGLAGDLALDFGFKATIRKRVTSYPQLNEWLSYTQLLTHWHINVTDKTESSDTVTTQAISFLNKIILIFLEK